MTKVLEKATPALAKPLQPKSEAELGKLKTKLADAGFRGEAAGSIFLGLKFAGLVAGLFLGGGTITVASRASTRSSLIMVSRVLAGVLFYLPDLVVWFLGRSRKQAIFLGLPDALDLMVVCVEAGLGLDQAMRKVADEMKKTYRILAEEFALANFQLQMGRPRAEVLHELGARTGVADLRALAARAHPGRQVRLQRGPGPPRAERLDAHPPPPIGRRKGRQDRRQADLPAGAVHLPRHLRDPRRPGRHHHGPEPLPCDVFGKLGGLGKV